MAKLYFKYGAMNCGKTTALLQTAYNYEEKGLKVKIFKPAVDTKAGDKISSRLGAERKVDYLIKEEDHIYDIIDKNDLPDVYLIDEAQFLTPEQVLEFYKITKEFDVGVIAYGLRNTFLIDQPFLGSPKLLLLADEIEELKTMCRCGRKATQHVRFLNGKPLFEGDAILIDGTSDVVYESVCGKCYFELAGQIKKEDNND